MSDNTHALLDPKRGNAPSSDPLYVDLRHGLLRSDVVAERALRLLKQSPWYLFHMLVWMLRGWAFVQKNVAARSDPEPATLLYFDDAVRAALRAKERGTRVVLVAGEDMELARSIASHLGLFDDVLASGASAQAKLIAIRGDARGAFCYAGADPPGSPLWEHASSAVFVGARAASGTSRWALMVSALRSMRPHQWAKNVLLLMPIVPVAASMTGMLWWSLLVAFVCFGLCASSVYVLNDLLDLDADRAHPRKQHRAIASGALPVRIAMPMVPCLLLAAFASAALWVTWQFAAVLGAYWAVTMLYSLRLKRQPTVDIMVLASLYTMRIVAGSAVILQPPSFWILAFSMFLFLSLAAAKRHVELQEMQASQKSEAPGRGYRTSDLPLVLALGVASGLVATMVFALYINDPTARGHFPQPYALWAVCPLLLYWVARLWMKVVRSELHDDPVVFALTDRQSQITALLCLIAVGIAL